MKTPSKEDFEQELARVLAQRLQDRYGSVYRLHKREETAFLLLLAALSCTVFAIASILWALWL